VKREIKEKCTHSFLFPKYSSFLSIGNVFLIGKLSGQFDKLWKCNEGAQ